MLSSHHGEAALGMTPLLTFIQPHAANVPTWRCHRVPVEHLEFRKSSLRTSPSHPREQPSTTRTSAPVAMLSSLGNPRQAAAQLLNFGLILSTAFMVRFPPSSHCSRPLSQANTVPCAQMWKGLSVLTDSPSPIVVVLSGSMEPAFQRGDLLLLWNRNWVQETDVRKPPGARSSLSTMTDNTGNRLER
jgi:hypothetical protein